MSECVVKPVRLIAGFGTNGTRIVDLYESKYGESDSPAKFRKFSRDYLHKGLDGYYQFDECEGELLNGALDGVRSVLVVVCAGGNAGTTMARFMTLFARSKNIPVEVVMTSALYWEGFARTARSKALLDDLRAMGAEVHKISGELIFKNDEMHLEEGLGIMDAQMLSQIDKWASEVASI